MPRWPQLTAGVDEVGRGPLAGPVVAAAVILPRGVRIEGLDDSKKLPPRRRAELAAAIKKRAIWGLGRAEVDEIDALNILQASLLAMQRAVSQLAQIPALALVDGNRGPALDCPTKTIIGGDALEPAISAASILAKVYRDEEMRQMEIRHPGYGFATNKGYPTRFHLAALSRLGPCSIHRRSFQPVRSALQQIALPLETE